MQMANSRGEPRPAQRTNSLLNLTPCEWNREFATRRPDLDYSRENIPYITTRGLDENVVRTFMQDPDESDVCSPQTDMVEAYCVGASLEALRADKGEASEPLVAYLDEREFEEGGGPGRQRPYREPFTARNLYRELKKPVSFLSLSHICNFAFEKTVKAHAWDFTLALPLWRFQPFFR